MPKFETGGAYYYVVVDRILFSLAVSNIMLAVYFVAQNIYGYAALVAPLPCIVMGKIIVCRQVSQQYLTILREVAVGEALLAHSFL